MEEYQSVGVQEKYLSKLQTQRTPSTIYTINGFQVRGIIKEYDNITVVVENGGEEQLVYKHAISTIAPFQRDDDRRQSKPHSGRSYRDFDRG